MKQLIKKVINKIILVLIRVLHLTRGGRIILDSITHNIRLTTYTVDRNNINLQFYTPNSLNYFRAKTFYKKEPETITWINDFNDGSIFWDIGANVGLYSCYAAKKKQCRVIAFEPSPFNLELLSKNIFINSLNNKITIFSMPITDSIKESKMKMSNIELGGALSTFGEEFGHDGKSIKSIFEYNTFGISGDKVIELMNIPQPENIKIDVDGIEHIILSGCGNLLVKTKSILIEVNDEFQEMSMQVKNILIKNNFVLKDKKQSEFIEKDSVYSKTYNQIWIKKVD